MKTVFARNKPTKCPNSTPKIIIYCEGRKTEPSYLEGLKKNCKLIPVPSKGNGISSCIKFVDEVEKKWNNLSVEKKAEYSQKWIMFDYDGHSDFEQAIKTAKSKNFRVAFSSMCIEYWFLLHFENHNGDAIPMKGSSHSKAQIDKINDYIKKYNNNNKKNKTLKSIPLYDSNSKEITEDLLDFMLAIDVNNKKRRIELAFERAMKIHETKKSKGCEYNESVTTIYELLIELGVFKKQLKYNGYEVFSKSEKKITRYYYIKGDKEIEINDDSNIKTEYKCNVK